MQMARETIDRRVARTREMLHQALMSLLLKTRYRAITIKDVCHAANVGRSTFYAHYTSKDDLKRCGLESMRRTLVDRQRDAVATSEEIRNRRWRFSLSMFEHARDHIYLYGALARAGLGAAVLGTIRQIVSDLVRDELAETADKNSADVMAREFIIQYVVGAYMAVMTWWLEGGAKLPPQQMDAMFRRLATEGIPPSGS
jgi:AcrR family transcriptional regulator